MVRVVVAEHDVRHRVWVDAELPQRPQDEVPRGHHARIDDRGHVPVAHEDDGAGDPVTDIAD